MVIGDQNELYHYGILGMKWGVRRFQPYSTTGGRKSGKGGKEIGEAAKHKERDKPLTEEEKKKMIRQGKASDIRNRSKELSNSEMREAVERLRLEQELSNFSQREKKDAMKEFDKMMKNVQMITRWTNDGITAYNTIARVYNATNEGKKKPLTVISSGEKKKK